MSELAGQIGRRTGYAILWPLLIGLPVALFAGGIGVATFTAVATLWLLVAIFLIIGPDSISEISFWKASIKTDAKAAKQARNEAEAIRDELKQVARLNIENVFVLNSLLAGIYASGGNPELPGAFGHVAANLEAMTPLISTDPVVVEAWQESMREVMKAG
ncbi:hypothetical protein AYK59_19180 [Pseudomonas synxantha]|uniref:hypothetical protein n=1 Tax=Pseudomonas TaxID=286 RepID=UPI00078C3A03|nr:MULTISPECIES: hypothetical protein [Pseudomonas]AMS22153.1 hypothetical protein AYK59_19180 [Pseudomonas synxantha]NWD65771.1 hypothetical protein [Pseudomonas sp. IPO3774]